MGGSANGATVWAMPTTTAVADRVDERCDPPDAVLRHGRVLLEEEEAAGAMRAVLEAVGVELVGVTPTQVRYQPGRRLAVRYRADVRRGQRAAVETLVGLWQPAPLPAGVAVVADDRGTRVGVWAYPHDPWLPGLAAVAGPVGARELLSDLGVRGGIRSVRPRVYRPTARAVLAVDGTVPAHLKVVQPGAAAALDAVHRRLGESLPVPATLGVSERLGVVALATCRGEPLRAALSSGRALPSPEELSRLLAAIADHEAVAPPIRPVAAACAARVVLAGIAPEVVGRVDAVVAAVAEQPYEPDRTVHGDFYDAQIVVADGAVSGLLDVEGLRAGDVVDDVATLLAHLDVVAARTPHAAGRVRGFGEAVRLVLGGDRGAADVRAAGMLLSLAAWPFRAQLPDWREHVSGIVGLAERRIARSRRAAARRALPSTWSRPARPPTLTSRA